jgi:glyoxylase-like metal-dependent hydrolase (beta-lactamase superfamily II)
MTLPAYELYAIRYATREARRSANFLGGDPHDAPMPMDYFLWLVKGPQGPVLIDTGFTADIAVKRGRTYLRTPLEGLAALDISPADIRTAILTHLHYDHVGGFALFPQAQFHLQDDEMRYATGRYMRYDRFNHGYEVEEVVDMVRLVYGQRVTFHDGDAEIAPGLTVHRIGGHTMGLQCVRVHTRRGWVVVASDASHYYEHFERNRCFTTVFHVGETIGGYEKLQRLADSPKHIIPGHDPLVMQRYPATSERTKGVVVRLDVAPAD